VKISYDPQADAVRIRFRETAVTPRELAEGLTAEYGADGRLAGLEIREAAERLGDLSTLRQVQLGGLGPPVSQGKPPSTIVTNHIVLDERGRAWIDDTNVKVIEVALDKLSEGWGPEKIHEQHPHLSLPQIHAALAYYYDHKAEFDAEIERQLQDYLALREAQGNNTPIHQKLRAAGKIP
jgi:uncharacterized protein (DUF433 family)/uncharacterized protein YuzE